MAKRRVRVPGIDLKVLQEEVAKWAQARWPNRSDYESGLDLPFYRIVSSAGNLMAVISALADGVLYDPVNDRRVDPDICREDLRRELGELVVMATEFAARQGWSINTIVEKAWADIQKEEPASRKRRD